MLGALDLLRTLGWGFISFIYSLIDVIFEILKQLNLYDIVSSVADNTSFSNFHTGILAIAVTLLALFIVWRFIMKILEPDEGLETKQIVLEILKCGLLIILSVFLFTQANTFSTKLSGYTSNMVTKNVSLSDTMLNMYITHADGYKESDEFKNENILKNLKNDTFSKKEMYNDKYVTSSRWILPDKKDYKYDINWIMAILVGGFFLYTLFFSGMMLAKRQIEFLFLFLISPIIFATSVGNKQRRSAVFEQLVSLILQSAVVMLIIGLTVIVMQAINSTTFFSNSALKDMVLKSLMFLGCAIFLLTGSQTINRFIGTNVSANSGREQFMSLMSYGHVANTVGTGAALTTTGVGAYGLGVGASAVGKLGGNKVVSKVGNVVQSFGSNMSKNETGNFASRKIGGVIERFGQGIGTKATPSSIGRNLRSYGKGNIGSVARGVMPSGNGRYYKNRR